MYTYPYMPPPNPAYSYVQSPHYAYPPQAGVYPPLAGRGLHSFTSQLNLSAFYGTGGAREGCVAHVKGVFRVCRMFLCVRHG
jgi:hypothetical protein